MRRKNKKSSGFTLLEATIALAIFLILSASVMTVFYNTSNATIFLRERQNTFEQARGSLDMLLINIQMAQSIVLHTDNYNTLITMTLYQRDPNGTLESYNFHFIADEQIISIGQRNRSNEFARNIKNVEVVPNQKTNPHRLYITITAACRCYFHSGNYCECATCECELIKLTGSVDVRHKSFQIR